MEKICWVCFILNVIIFGVAFFYLNNRIVSLSNITNDAVTLLKSENFAKQQTWLNQQIVKDEELARVKNLNTSFLEKYGNPPRALAHITAPTGLLLEEARRVYIESNGNFDLSRYWECVENLPKDLGYNQKLEASCRMFLK
jgi:hypothetical protein